MWNNRCRCKTLGLKAISKHHFSHRLKFYKGKIWQNLTIQQLPHYISSISKMKIEQGRLNNTWQTWFCINFKNDIFCPKAQSPTFFRHSILDSNFHSYIQSPSLKRGWKCENVPKEPFKIPSKDFRRILQRIWNSRWQSEAFCRTNILDNRFRTINLAFKQETVGAANKTLIQALLC